MSIDPLQSRAYPGSLWEYIPSNIQQSDEAVRSLLSSSVNREQHPWKDLVWLTEKPSGIMSMLVLMFAIIFWKRRRQFFQTSVLSRFVVFVGFLGLSDLCSHFLKIKVGRLKPHVSFVNNSQEFLPAFSFPSNHAFNCAFVFVFLLLFFGQSWTSPNVLKFKIYGALIVLLVGVSRIILGEHYPLDVLGGWVLGLIFSQLSFAIFLLIFPASTRKRWFLK